MRYRFFVIFLLTLTIVRAAVFFFPVASPTFGTFRVHHYMYGIVLIMLGLFFRRVTLYAVGLALFVDELTYLLVGGKTHEDNYSGISLAGTALFTFLVFLLKDYLVKPFVRER